MEMMQKDKRFVEMENKILGWIRKYYPNGYSLCDYADSELDSATINEILKSGHPNEEFRDRIMDSFLDCECDVYSDIWNELVEDLGLTADEESYLYDRYDDFMEVLKDNLSMNFPFDQYRSQMVCCNLVLDNGDAASDFSYHDCYPHFRAERFHHNLSRKSGMMGMAHLEGYSTKQFRKIYNQYKKAVMSENKEKVSALEQKYPFVTSCYNELDGCTTSMSAFVICFKMTLGELLDWNENKRDVQISHTANAGLCDFWNGTGGNMEVTLEKDTVIPKEKIFALLPDDAWNHTEDGIYTGYGITEIYGMCESFWKVA